MHCFLFKFTLVLNSVPVLEIGGLQVPAWYIGDFALFNVCSSGKNCPSARCASAANVVCRNAHVFRAKNVILNHIL
jgi:hypothetical protein